MKYYKIQYAKEGIGIFPQVINIVLGKGCTIDDSDYISRFQFKQINKPVVVPKAVLRKKAKLTHLLSAIPAGFEGRLLVSKPLKEILERDSYGVQFIETKVIAETEIDYFIVHPYTPKDSANKRAEFFTDKDMNFYISEGVKNEIELTLINSGMDIRMKQ